MAAHPRLGARGVTVFDDIDDLQHLDGQQLVSSDSITVDQQRNDR
jgi:hypothetical protein